MTFGNGFSGSAASLSLNGGASLDGSGLELTDGNGNENRSAFYMHEVNVQKFTSDFTFQLTDAVADGFTFTLQGNTASTLASGGNGGGLGYAGMPNSIAIKFDLYNNAGEGLNSTGLFENGAEPYTPSTDLTNYLNLHSGDVFAVHMTYDGTNLEVDLTDTANGKSFSSNYTVDIPSLVGGNTAYAGFTAGTGGYAAIQKILTWTYTPQNVNFVDGFSGTATGLNLNGGAAIDGSELMLTDGSGNEARSAFYPNSINVQNFETKFTFQLTNTNADGITFCIQDAGVGAVGAFGGGLGYAGIPQSVAIKFDLYNNAGEGINSTGLYTNGANPFTPSIDLTNTGINLNTGHPINVTIGYNGTTLSVTEIDLVNFATATQSYQVKILPSEYSTVGRQQFCVCGIHSGHRRRECNSRDFELAVLVLVQQGCFSARTNRTEMSGEKMQ